jgi:hypothetical protein
MMNPPTLLWPLLFCLMAFSGCQAEPEDPKARLLGSWGVDIAATFNVDPELSRLSKSTRTQVKRLAGEFLESMRIEFSKDGRLVTRAGGHRIRGRYTVDRVDGPRLVLTVTDEKQPGARPAEKMQIVFNEKQMQLARGAQTLVLSRR